MHFHFCLCRRVSVKLFCRFAIIDNTVPPSQSGMPLQRLICMHGLLIAKAIESKREKNMQRHIARTKCNSKGSVFPACKNFLRKQKLIFVLVAKLKAHCQGTKAVMKNQNSFKLLFMVIIFSRFLRI